MSNSEVTIMVSSEAYRRLDALRRQKETDEELLLRLALAVRSAGLVSEEEEPGGNDNA